MSSSPKVARKWMSEEDKRLRSILNSIEPGADINWHHVASHIPGRNNKECRKRWIYALMPTLRKGPWNESEDALLLEGVRLHGLKWPLVSQTVGTRQPDQCSRRWHESLNPNINHGRWSLYEDQVLREAVQTYGRRWTEIVERFFPNRTPIAAKKRYAQCFQTKVKSSKSDSEYDERSDIPQHTSNSPKLFKQEEYESSSQLLWSVPDHSQSQSTPGRPAYTSAGGPRFLAEPSLSTPVVPSLSQYAAQIDMNHTAYTAPNTPHYVNSPTFSRDGSLGGASSIAEYPVVTSEPHHWMPVETSQPSYSGTSYAYQEPQTGYFDSNTYAYGGQHMAVGH